MTTRLLIATVGGSPEPLIASLLKWRPSRSVFIASNETRAKVSDEIIPGVRSNGWPEFDAGHCDIEEIGDAQDYSSLVTRIGRLEARVNSWITDQPSAEVLADITGGTKPMSCALALAASRWPGCKVTYVGGTERNKDGVGIVITGKEQIVDCPNPWEAMGRQALDVALALLRENSGTAAAALLKAALPRINDPARKAEASALMNLVEALTAWERFAHSTALNLLKGVAKQANNLEAVLGRDFAPDLQKATKHLEGIVSEESAKCRLLLVHDLLANADRRLMEGRYDDAVARLYRAIEAYAQVRLASHGFDNTGAVPLEKLPDSLQTEWQFRTEDGALKLGLQDNYKLLAELGDDAAAQFKELNLDDSQKSLLVARNNSILAHGYAPAGKETAERLLDAALKLVAATQDTLTAFPSFNKQPKPHKAP